MNEIDNLLANFLIESREHLNSVEDDILELEKSGSDFDREVVNGLFRAMHSIKGGSGFLDLNNITELSHSLENVIDNIRKDKLVPNEYIADTLLKGVDKLNELINNIENESNIDIQQEVSDLKQLISSPIINQEKDSYKKINEEAKSKPSTKLTLSHEKIEETKIIKKKEIKSISIENIPNLENRFITYNCSIDLIEECDKKHRSPEELLKNLNIVGKIVDADYDLSKIGTILDKADDKLIFNFSISTVIDDTDIFIEALDIKPVFINPIEYKEPEKISMKETEHSVITRDKKSFSNLKEMPDKTRTINRGSVLKRILEKRAQLPQKQELLQDKKIAVKTGMIPLKKQFAAPVKQPASNIKKLYIKKPGSSTIRIPLDLLDILMKYASELVLVRNQNMQAVETEDIEQLRNISKKLNVVTSGLQAGILKTRMQPVDTIFSKFTRIVRDLSKKVGKEVSLVIEGKDVELDKTILEALSDPLTHLIRNAIDHGIETPDERETLNKNRKGRIVLGAYYISGQVNIKITDDGKGMNPASLIQSAVEKGVITVKQSKKFKDADAFDLIFRPGFSTVKEVTDLSGRGVGMDVVKTNLQNIGGSINILSKSGSGTTFDIRLPLTLRIMQALIIIAEDICFAIPQFNISEVVRLQGEEVYTGLEKVNEQEIFPLRDVLIPIIRLKDILKIKNTYKDPKTKEIKQDRRKSTEEELKKKLNRTAFENHLYIIILKLGNLNYGLIIDDIIDTEEIVIKPLHEQLKKYRVFAGTTVLGDGGIAMILDIANLAEKATFNLNKIERIIKKEKTIKEDKQTFIIFTIGGKENFAVPLFLISHIEKIEQKDIQFSNNKEYFKFREDIIQIARIEQALDDIESNYLNDVFVIIIKSKKSIGLLVSQIIDTSMISSNFKTHSIEKPGIIGIIMINNKLTTILDIFSIIEIIEPAWYLDTSLKEVKTKKILLLEDTKFYASIIISYLSGFGVEVILAKNGKQGLEILEKSNFDIIISDLQMPVMDGFDFARKVRSNDKYNNIKLIALSSVYAKTEGEVLAKEAGFDKYVSKLNRESMIECLNSISAGFGE